MFGQKSCGQSESHCFSKWQRNALAKVGPSGDPIDNEYVIYKCENVSYDVESLFTSVAVEEAINYITNQIYVQKEIEPFSKKIF